MNKKHYLFRLAAGAALCAFFLLRPASAGVWDKKTDIRLSHPVELPGRVVLPSGEYVMKLYDSPSQRHIVQVFNKEQNHVYATIQAIPTQRPEPAERTLIAFYETPGNQPMFIRHWFYPGDTIGQEFVYSQDRAKYIASLSGSSVPATDGERQFRERPRSEAAAMNRQEPERLPEVAQANPPARQEPRDEPQAEVSDAAPAVAAAEPVPAPAPEPAPEPSPEPAPQAQPADPGAAQTTERDVLPETAGFGVGIGLAGISLLAAAATVRATRNRRW